MISERNTTLDDDICVHIFASSGAMVGVCLTVVGILRVVINVRQEDLIGQNLLAINAIVYLTTCLIAYWALRTRKAKRNYQLERIADGLFLLGLTLTTITTGFITFAMSTA
ncbi:hypothetical protein [Pseudomonas sp.]|jgi:hypothetical protein|uniref:hypothetical protein n=1 Tax=Pseudomonas sp. TaxID=306 RepID=UPI003F31D241